MANNSNNNISIFKKICFILSSLIILQLVVLMFICIDVKNIYIHIERIIKLTQYRDISGVPSNATLLREPASMISTFRVTQKIKHRKAASNVSTTHGIEIKHMSLCPETPPGLVGPINVSMEAPSMETLEKRYSWLELGGRWRPKNCNSRYKVAIIVPYRNRVEQLKIFLNNLHPFLQKQQLDYAIYIVEQVSNTTFNRGMLMNIGFVEASRLYDYHCYIFHDVDLLPEDDRNIYSCPNQMKPRHMSVAVDKFNYKLPYKSIFGGVCALTKEQVHTTNGFSNIFFGWGGEDDDLAARVRLNKYTMQRYPIDVARYKMVKHGRDQKINDERGEILKTSHKRWKEDGVNSLKYGRKSLDMFKLYTRVLVFLNETEIRATYIPRTKK